MPIYRALGSALVTQDESIERQADLLRLRGAKARGTKALSVELSTGVASQKNLVATHVPFTANGGKKTPAIAWTEVGPGKPLVVMVTTVYTGKHPQSVFGGSAKKDLLLTSAVKSIATSGACPRALNFLCPKTSAGSTLQTPAATAQGTPIVFYVPALVDSALTVSFDLIFDRWPEETLGNLGGAFTSLAGVPLFFAHSTYLLAAGSLLKAVGQMGEALFDKAPVLSLSEMLNFAFAGKPIAAAGYYLITSGKEDATITVDYQVDESGRLVHCQTGKEYRGDEPYVVLSVDGRAHDDLKDFVPAAVGAELLGRFFGQKDQATASIDALVEATKLYSDFRFRSKVDELDRRIAEAQKKGKPVDDLQEQRAAFAENILADLFKST